MQKKLFLSIAVISILLIISAAAHASPGADVRYNETDLGEGLWQYDYTFNNTSDAGESLYGVYFYFDQDTSFTGTSLPTGWDGIVWDGNTWATTFTETYSTDSGYDIAAGSSKNNFNFTVDYQAGDISYDAYFSDYQTVSGTTAVAIVPEPISSALFISGGILLGGRRFFRKTS